MRTARKIDNNYYRRDKIVKVANGPFTARKSEFSISKNYFKRLFFLIIISVLFSVIYLTLRSELTLKYNKYIDLTEKYDKIKTDNESLYNNIKDNNDIESIRDTAINEYNMIYPSKEQIIIYSNNSENNIIKYNK